MPQPVTTPSPGIFDLLHAEIGAAVLDEHVELLERALVEEEFDPLARRQLAALVLGIDAGLATAQPRIVAPALELVDDVLHGASSEGGVNSRPVLSTTGQARNI